jgi:hypothetical protein
MNTIEQHFAGVAIGGEDAAGPAAETAAVRVIDE